MLGGSSGINYMQTTFAGQRDLDDWEALGNEGWNYATMAPYYKKFENFQSPQPFVEELDFSEYIQPEIHGSIGPINVSFAPWYTDIQLAWTPTLANMGLAPTPGDPRDGKSLGGYTNPMAMTRGLAQRSFSGNSYWLPFADRPNLHVITGSIVNKIMFSPDTSQGLLATGLNFTTGNKTYIVNATKEVIISGGTMKSPQTLELSGIGSPSILSAQGIEVLYSNPNVGENLQDHPQCGAAFTPNDGELNFDQLFNETQLQHWIDVYETNQTGMLTSGITQTAQLSWHQILGPHQQSRPSDLIAKLYNSSSISDKPGLKAQLDLTALKLADPNDQAIQTGTLAGTGRKPIQGEENTVANIGGFVAHPFSRGWIHIASPDASADPKFDPRYLSHPLDYEVLKDLVLFSLNISTTPPLSSHLKDNGTALAGGLAFLNETNVRSVINKSFITGWHVVGSNAMMPRDKGGVVDTRLKVYGTKNVRVVDASIVPLHVRGNTGTLTYAIAERGADLIKVDGGVEVDEVFAAEGIPGRGSGSGESVFRGEGEKMGVRWRVPLGAVLGVAVGMVVV